MRRKGYCLNNDLIAPLTSVLDRRIMGRPGATGRRMKVMRSYGGGALSRNTYTGGGMLVVSG